MENEESTESLEQIESDEIDAETKNKNEHLEMENEISEPFGAELMLTLEELLKGEREEVFFKKLLKFVNEGVSFSYCYRITQWKLSLKKTTNKQ